MCAWETAQVTRQGSLLRLIDQEAGRTLVNALLLLVVFCIELLVHTQCKLSTPGNKLVVSRLASPL